jgi:YidC/Oxa1 family membrane protein insertase
MSNWGPILYLAHLLHPVLAGIDYVVHDWGLAVILLTLIVRLVLFPLSVRQARFAYRNKAFSKAYKQLREKHKDDLDTLQAETKKLTIEQKYNPFGMLGTLVLQMPIMAAVYAVFYHFGSNITSALIPWASALAHTDPLHIVPIIVAVLSAAGSLVPMVDPEATMKLAGRALPIVMMVPMMAFFLWKAPVAIGLYMATSSLWGMAERGFLRTMYAVKKFRLHP